MFKEKRHGRYNEITPEKKALFKKLYMSGLPITVIAKTLGGLKVRTVYHHLRPLTPDDKAEHSRNLAIRKDTERREKREAKELKEGKNVGQ